MSDLVCISCGMPMRKPEEHAKGDVSKNYCCYCAAPDGSLKSYEAALEGMAGFITRTQGLDAEAARRTAKAMMAKMPAWKGHSA